LQKKLSAYIQLLKLIAFQWEVLTVEKKANTRVRNIQTPEVKVIIHYADDGPSLESCMVSILNAHLPKNTVF